MKKRLLRSFGVAAFAASLLSANAQVVTTVAGNGVFGNADGSGIAANFAVPRGICTDGTNLYLADGQVIRKIVIATGVVTTIAGSRTAGGGADGFGGAATMMTPTYMYYDGGNIIFCDETRVRMLELNNNNYVLTTKAWSPGAAGVNGICRDSTGMGFIARGNPAGSTPASGNLICKLTDPGGNPVVTDLAGNGNDGGAGDMDGTGVAPAGNVTAGPKFNGPQGMCVIGGNIYVADTNSNKIKKIVIATGVVTTFAGSGAAGAADGTGAAATFNTPRDICGNATYLFVADTGNHRIRRITISTGAVITWAGSSVVGSADGVGTSVTFDSPAGICIDSTGNRLYVTDWGSKKVRMVYANWTSTFAGSGAAGAVNGTGAAAQFNTPRGVVVDRDAGGNSYVIDYKSNVIRKITSAGVVTTFAGSGVVGAADGTGTAASFNAPQQGCIDIYGQNLYVTDTSNHSIRKIVLATGVVTTIAGGGGAGYVDGTGAAAKFNNPSGIDMDSSGNLYVADYTNHRVRKVVPSSGAVTTVAGSGVAGAADGTGTAATFNHPATLCLDTAGNIYVTEYSNHKIRKIIPSTGVVSTFAGSGVIGAADGVGTAATFNGPWGIAADKFGRLFVADSANNKLRCITIATKKVVSIAGTGTAGAAEGAFGPLATFNQPFGICTDKQGNVVVADTLNNKIRKLRVSWDVDTSPLAVYVPPPTPTTTYVSTNATVSTIQNFGLGLPSSVSVVNGRIYVAEYQYNKISYLTQAGVLTDVSGVTQGNSDGAGTAKAATGATPVAAHTRPSAACADSAENVYIADAGNVRIRKFTKATGDVTTIAGNTAAFADGTGTAAGFQEMYGICLDPTGTILYVCDRATIRKVDVATGVVTTLAGNGGTYGDYLDGTGIAARLNLPKAVCCDSAGNLYVADYVNNRIRKVTPAGVVTTFAGTGAQSSIDGPAGTATFNYPKAVAIDNAKGCLYVLDASSRVRRILLATGAVATVAGSDTAGSADGSGPQASFSGCSGICVDSAGVIYVAEGGNNRIRKIVP